MPTAKSLFLQTHLHLHPPYFGGWVSLLFGQSLPLVLSHSPIPRSCQIKTVRSIKDDKNRYFEVFPKSPSLSLSFSLTPLLLHPHCDSPSFWTSRVRKSICGGVHPYSAEYAPTGLAACLPAHTHTHILTRAHTHTHTHTHTDSTQFTTSQTKSQPLPQPLRLSVSG